MTAHFQLVSPLQLQINQSGAWRSAIDFDVPAEAPVPISVLLAAVELVEATTASDVQLRIVRRKPGANGRAVATDTVLMRWSEKTGWMPVSEPI